MAIERRHYQSPLLYWAKERECIRIKKAAGEPAPWTEDIILQTYRFCNVRREYDRVSQWIIENVLSYYYEFDDPMVFYKWVALCRWVNWPPTLGEMLVGGAGDLVTYDQIDLKRIGKFIDKRTTSGEKAWTGAYMVRAPSKRSYPGYTKGRFVAEVVVGAIDEFKEPLLEAIKTNYTSEVWRVMSSVPNWGSFMAGQFVADLTYTDLLGCAHDLNGWAPQGPGSRRGFNRLLGRGLYDKISEHDWSYYIQKWRAEVAEAIGSELNAMDLQNCLCEVDKYLRVKTGEGRPRSKYRPETAF